MFFFGIMFSSFSLMFISFDHSQASMSSYFDKILSIVFSSLLCVLWLSISYQCGSFLVVYCGSNLPTSVEEPFLVLYLFLFSHIFYSYNNSQAMLLNFLLKIHIFRAVWLSTSPLPIRVFGVLYYSHFSIMFFNFMTRIIILYHYGERL